MAKKPRTKSIPFDNTATEASPGEWSWVLKGRTWRLARVTSSLNLCSLSTQPATFTPLAYASEPQGGGHVCRGLHRGI
jgi:hypothetical protein